MSDTNKRKLLNTDENGISYTPAEYNENLEKWIINSQNWFLGQNEALTQVSDQNPYPVKVVTNKIPVESTLTLSSAPVVGSKTVISTAAEIFAGSSRLANRYSMTIHNDSTVTVYWGPSTVTTANGFPLLPGDSVTLKFKSSVAVPIYAIAQSNAVVRVVELK